MVIHWKLCHRHGFPTEEKWYDHRIEKVLENDKVKILWDFKIQTDKVIEHSRPDITLIEKDKRVCTMIEVTCPFDSRVAEREIEKIERYQDLKYEIIRLWNCKKVKIIPVVIGALGTVSKSLKKYLTELQMEKLFSVMQKACLLGTSRILRKVLDI